MTIEKATIRQVWRARPDGKHIIVIRRESDGERVVTWTKDAWLASLCDRYADPAGRTEVSVLFEETTHQLTSVGLQVAA